MKLEGQMKPEGHVKAGVTRGAESWQFFAFVFSALVFWEFAWISEIPLIWLRMPMEGLAIVVTFYLVLWNPWIRNRLVGILGRIKEAENR